jgi:hypothetical protein
MNKTKNDIQKECINTILKFPITFATVGLGIG